MGFGKSYFMGLLRQQISELAEAPGQLYHKHIEQIGFNAWHYADTNLWASLAHKVFDHLAGMAHAAAPQRREVAGRVEHNRRERERLALELDVSRAEAASRRDELDAARAMNTSPNKC